MSPTSPGFKRSGIYALIVAMVFLIASGPAVFNTWNASYEGNPAANDPVSQGDDWMRKMKEENRRRLQVEHQFGTGFGSVSGDNGMHRLGSGRCFVQTAQPTNVEVAAYDNTGGAGTSLLSDDETNRAPAQKVGQGRCWIDTDGADATAGTSDDNTFWLYDTGWKQITAGNDGGLPFINWRNILRNGGFEVGSGATAPEGWSAVNTPTLSYSSTDISEGTGQELHVTAAGGADEGISQTFSNLRTATSYYVAARVFATAGDTCSVRTTGGFVNLTKTTVFTGTYETLSGIFTTSVVPDPVVLILEANADTDVCKFDHVAVYKVGSVLSNPAVPTASSWVDVLPPVTVELDANPKTIITSPTYRVEGNNCYFFVTSSVDISVFSGETATNPLLRVSVNGGAASTVYAAQDIIGDTQETTFMAEFYPEVAAGSTYAFSTEVGLSPGVVPPTSDVDGTMSVELRCPGD